MNEGIAVALISSGFALVSTLGVALIRILSAPSRLERRVDALVKLSPLVDSGRPGAEDAFRKIAGHISSSFQIFPWWARPVFATSGLLASLVAGSISAALVGDYQSKIDWDSQALAGGGYFSSLILPSVFIFIFVILAVLSFAQAVVGVYLSKPKETHSSDQTETSKA